MLALDLGVFHRKAHEVSKRESFAWFLAWVSLALIFNGIVYVWQGGPKALEYFTGYLIEYSLSVDNIFVFLLIFSYFSVPPPYRHRVLFWGILGAVIMRLGFIALGTALLARFHLVIYVFGALLVVTGIKFLLEREAHIEPEKNPLLRLFRRFFPITPDYRGQHFFLREAGRWMATPLFVVLLVVESTDVVFAIDSIPAIFAITRDPFIVFTSNVFAILGLRSLYFLLAGVMGMFRYLRPGLGLVLMFVGVKMLLSDLYKIPTGVSLAVIAIILGVAGGASLWAARRERRGQRSAPAAADPPGDQTDSQEPKDQAPRQD
ncbi:MAG: TerC family protein [Acidobacteria bacterium]|nr:TerC family protein [Acidobacteriota bacterium]